MDTVQDNLTEMEPMEVPSNQIQCSPCSGNNERGKAAKYCMECRDYYCKKCVDRHNWFPALKKHTLCEVDGRAGTRIPGMSVITLTCDVHKLETIDAYCTHHEALLCAKCLKENHSSCTGVVDIAEAASDSSKHMGLMDVVDESLQVDQRLNETIVTLNEELEHLNQSKDEAIIEIKEYRGELDLTLLQLERDSIDYVQYIHDKLAATILNEKETVVNNEHALQAMRFKQEIPFVSPDQQFIALHHQMKKMAKVKKALNSMTRTARFEVKFTADPDIKGFLRSKLALGEIEAVKKANLYSFSHVRKLYVKNADTDRFTCNITASCVTLDGQYLLVTDLNNDNVKRLELRNHCVLKDYYRCPGSTGGLCCLSLEEAAVIVYQRGVYVLSLVGNMRVTRIIDQCQYGDDLVYISNKLYVSSCTDSDNIGMYDLNGQLVKTISTDESGNKLFSSSQNIAADENKDRVYVADAKKGLVILNTNGEHIVTVSHKLLNFSEGVCTDGNGCVFVSGANSKNIFQYNEENGKLYELVKASTDIGSPQSICFAECDGRKCIMVTSHFSDYVYKCYVDRSQ